MFTNPFYNLYESVEFKKTTTKKQTTTKPLSKYRQHTYTNLLTVTQMVNLNKFWNELADSHSHHCSWEWKKDEKFCEETSAFVSASFRGGLEGSTSNTHPSPACSSAIFSVTRITVRSVCASVCRQTHSGATCLAFSCVLIALRLSCITEQKD